MHAKSECLIYRFLKIRTINRACLIVQRAASPNLVPVTIGMNMLTPSTGSWTIVSFQSICNIMRMVNSNNKIFRQTVNKWHILVRTTRIGLRCTAILSYKCVFKCQRKIRLAFGRLVMAFAKKIFLVIKENYIRNQKLLQLNIHLHHMAN